MRRVLEVAASEVIFGLQVSDDRLDGGVAAQLALDDTEDAALLARDEDAAGILCLVTAASPVDYFAMMWRAWIEGLLALEGATGAVYQRASTDAIGRTAADRLDKIILILARARLRSEAQHGRENVGLEQHAQWLSTSSSSAS